MADLNPLIRLRKYRVEEKQKALAELFRQTELLEGRKRHLLDELEREQNLAETSQNVDDIMSFVSYAARIYAEVETLDRNIAKMEPRIRKAQDDMREAFSEQKKAEIIQEQRDAEEVAAIARKENATLDDIGVEVYRRRSDND